MCLRGLCVCVGESELNASLQITSDAHQQSSSTIRVWESDVFYSFMPLESPLWRIYNYYVIITLLHNYYTITFFSPCTNSPLETVFATPSFFESWKTWPVGGNSGPACQIKQRHTACDAFPFFFSPFPSSPSFFNVGSGAQRTQESVKDGEQRDTSSFKYSEKSSSQTKPGFCLWSWKKKRLYVQRKDVLQKSHKRSRYCLHWVEINW